MLSRGDCPESDEAGEQSEQDGDGKHQKNDRDRNTSSGTVRAMSTRRAAIYARQSLDRTGERLAVDRQLADCRQLVERQGWSTVGTYVDNDVSASSGKARPEYRRLLDDVRAGRVDTIVSWAPDRLARRPRDLEDVLDLAEHHGLTLATVSGDVDLGTAYGRAVARIFGAIARQEGDQKGARQKRANLQRATAGEARWTRRPYGFTRAADGTVAVVEAEAAELRKAAEGVDEGRSLRSMAADLNARHVPTSLGGPWSVRTLRAVLLNPKLSGRVVYRGEDVGRGNWEPILDDRTAERVRSTLTDPSRRTQTDTRVRYLLSGLVVCGKCGDRLFHSPMVGVGGRRWSVYRCRRNQHLNRRQDLVDEVVEAAVIGRLSRPDAVDLFTRDTGGAAKLTARASLLRQRLDGLADLLADGSLTAAAVRRSSEKLRGQLAEVEAERAQQTSSPEVARLTAAADVGAAWATLTLTARRTVVDALLIATVLPVTRGARFTPQQVRIDWKVGA